MKEEKEKAENETGEKEPGEKEKKIFRMELSRATIFFWSLGFLIFLGWIFTLGVLVGRGLLPSGAGTLAEVKNQIVRLQEMVGQKETGELDKIKAVQKDANFAFYEELSSKRKAPVVSPPKEPPQEKPQQKKPQQKKVPADHVKTPSPSSPGSGLYVVQVASLDQEKQAFDMVNRLVKKGYPAYHYKIFIKGRNYFRVRCGTFKTRNEALDTQQRLAENEHLKGFVQKIDR